MKLIRPAFIFLLMLSSCGLDCVDKKTGIHKSSSTMQYAKDNGLFRFEFIPEAKNVLLDSGRVFKINNAWVENSWSFECINNKAVIVKERDWQIVIDGVVKQDAAGTEYWLEKKGDSSGCALSAVLCFPYKQGDSVSFIISKSDTSGFNQRMTLAEFRFYKRTDQ